MPATPNKQRALSQLLSEIPKLTDERDPGASRTVLEQFLYAVCREGTTRALADRAFHALRESFFDWNEVRVSSVREVADALDELPRPESRAQRIITFLQEVFETTFSFDLEGLHKKGLKEAAKKLDRFEAANDYSVRSSCSRASAATPCRWTARRCAWRGGWASSSQTRPTPNRSAPAWNTRSPRPRAPASRTRSASSRSNSA